MSLWLLVIAAIENEHFLFHIYIYVYTYTMKYKYIFSIYNIYTTIYYINIFSHKKNKITSFAATEIDLEIVILS